MIIKIFIFTIILLVYCGNIPKDENTGNNPDYNDIFIHIERDDSVIIFWDCQKQFFDTIQSYELLYHTVSDTGWKLLKSNIPQEDSPHVTIYRNEIEVEDSIIFFGVRSVTMEGAKSDIHSSEDTTAYRGRWAALWYMLN